ncbi:zinc-dependent peptidase [Winogradskyella sp.]|uniref:zinc-dependent peptidase n=1 Tax=Winogradskyella sp. TaxID=1883156 RepID=UPI0025EA940F|nr:zinc-dependent peptidase [Winogradskyella sp.]
MILIYLQETEAPAMNPTLKLVFVIIICTGLVVIILSRLFIFFERQYVIKSKTPFFLNAILFSNQLSEKQFHILKNEFSFYSKLNNVEQSVFRHRVATFIKTKSFVGREGIVPTDEMKTLIASTSVMLTFGFRNYHLNIVETIIIYPKVYYSQINETYHKGETNPKLKAIVFSWEDFKHGYKIGDDNLNLGIHEFGHAIHLNAFINDDVSSLIFSNGFDGLTNYLQNNEAVRKDLIASKYFRAYAYTNHFEFFAVLLENFIETPLEFKSQFPELYKLMKQMLNFKFAGY